MAEDCTQEAFINAWRALDRFEDRSSMATWLHRIAVNVVLGKRRKAAPMMVDWDSLVPAGEDEPIESEWTLETPLEVNEIETAIGEFTGWRAGRSGVVCDIWLFTLRGRRDARRSGRYLQGATAPRARAAAGPVGCGGRLI